MDSVHPASCRPCCPTIFQSSMLSHAVPEFHAIPEFHAVPCYSRVPCCPVLFQSSMLSHAAWAMLFLSSPLFQSSLLALPPSPPPALRGYPLTPPPRGGGEIGPGGLRPARGAREVTAQPRTGGGRGMLRTNPELLFIQLQRRRYSRFHI